MKSVSQKKDHILYDSLYMKYPKEVNPRDRKKLRGFQELEGEGRGSDCLMCIRVSSGVIKVPWNLVSVVVANTVND